MKFRIDQKIFEQYPEVLLGVVVLHNVNNKGEGEGLSQLLRETEKLTVEKIGDIPVAEHPNIISWREVYRKFGAKPKDYPSSIENLIRRILKGEQVRHINKLVDIYNVISLRHLVPVGGEDTEKINGDVLLTFAGDNEKAIFLLGEKEARPPYPNEVIYKDDAGAICRRWNWKEADRTKLTEETTDAFMTIEALPPVKKEQLQTALSELSEMLKKYCNCEVAVIVLNRDNLEVDIK
ncbi:MAG: phenylalanine--tRNA ligase beta subunit-related protein [Patescibacteria group bacterium]